MFRKGGKFRFILSDIVSGDTFVLPAGCKIDAIVAQAAVGTVSAVHLGTAAGGTQIVGNTEVEVGIELLSLTAGVFSMTADTTVHITATIGAGEALTLYVLMSMLD